jgi:nucleotidyltransferase/DNA polymerase involved in DNA repair
MKSGLKSIKIGDIRMCGGKVGDIFTRNGIQTMGEIQEIDVSDLK